MTRQELIQIIERKVAEQELELQVDRQALAILRKGSGKGPIVYGNGHHDGKKPKSVPTQGVKGLTVDKVVAIMKANPKGLTLTEIQAILSKKDGIHISTSSVYNAFRRQNVEKLTQPGSPAKAYRIVE